MELLRTLGALIEPPSPDHRRLAEILELGPAPSAAEHTDLFSFQLYPYASVYLGAEGRLGGEARDLVAGFWRVHGEAPPAEPDHLTVMLALHAELRERELGRDTSRQAQHWRRVGRAFLWEHLLSWLPVYLDKLEQVAPRYYRRWAGLLREALAAEAERLGRQDQPSLHLRQAPALVDPRQGDAQAFLDTLLSPVRSGLILVRDDLVRAGRELGLGVRAGERKFVLKALLSQEPAVTLGWLAREGRAWAARHRANALLGAGAEPWATKAETLAALAEDLSRNASSVAG